MHRLGHGDRDRDRAHRRSVETTATPPAPRQPRLLAAQRAALCYFGTGGGPQIAQRAVRRFAAAALVAALLLPALFWLRFGAVGEFGWGATIFVVMFCLLSALGIFFADRPRYHSPVPIKGDWLDNLGAFWLVACALGPLLGWLLTEAPIPTVESWRWQFAGRTLLAVVVPIATALPLMRYARGGAAVIALALLIGVTALPVLSAAGTMLDLRDGAVVRQFVLMPTAEATLRCLSLDGGLLDIPCGARAWGRPGDTVSVTYLRHTGRLLNVRPVTSTA